MDLADGIEKSADEMYDHILVHLGVSPAQPCHRNFNLTTHGILKTDSNEPRPLIANDDFILCDEDKDPETDETGHFKFIISRLKIKTVENECWRVNLYKRQKSGRGAKLAELGNLSLGEAVLTFFFSMKPEAEVHQNEEGEDVLAGQIADAERSEFSIVKFEADMNGMLNIYLNVGLFHENLSALEYIHILADRYRNDDQNVQEEIQKQLQFKQVTSPQLHNQAVIHSVRWDLNPSSPMPSTRRRRKLTIADVFADGAELKYKEAPPILFEYTNASKAYTQLDGRMQPNCQGPVNFDEVNVIIPELYQMTGTTNMISEDGRAVARDDNHFTERQLELLTQRYFERLIKMDEFKSMFEKWFQTRVTRKNLTLIKCSEKSELQVRVDKHILSLDNWIILHNEDLGEIGKVGTTIHEYSEKLRASNPDIRIKQATSIGITPERAQLTDAWLEKIEEHVTPRVQLVVIIQESLREDIFHAVKRQLIMKHVPCLCWQAQRIPTEDRDRWMQKYARKRYEEIITKIGSKNQTRGRCCLIGEICFWTDLTAVVLKQSLKFFSTCNE